MPFEKGNKIGQGRPKGAKNKATSEKICPYIVCRFQWRLKRIMASKP